MSFSMYNVIGRRYIRKYSNVEIITVVISTGFLVFNSVAIGQHIFNNDLSSFILPLKTPSFILSVLFLGVFATLLTSYLLFYALSHLESFKVGIFGSISTVVSIIAGVLILNEQIYLYHIIGSTIIISDVLATNLLKGKEKLSKGVLHE